MKILILDPTLHQRPYRRAFITFLASLMGLIGASLITITLGLIGVENVLNVFFLLLFCSIGCVGLLGGYLTRETKEGAITAFIGAYMLLMILFGPLCLLLLITSFFTRFQELVNPDLITNAYWGLSTSGMQFLIATLGLIFVSIFSLLLGCISAIFGAIGGYYSRRFKKRQQVLT
ncbi:MAG: hypothetical protein ACFFCZ_09270 [Promethearchaeota archaeon]